MDIEKSIPMYSQEEINPREPGDYIVDGLLYCGKCGKPKQHRIEIQGHPVLVVPCVCDCRASAIAEMEKAIKHADDMRYIEQLRASALMAGKFEDCRFSSYEKREENTPAYNVAVNYCRHWSEMKEKNQGLLFYGPVGTGKSYTAACIANELLNQMISVVMTSFVKILQDIRASEDEGEYLAAMNRAQLLIIDDLGAERNTDYALEKVYNVIDGRIRAGKPMILTTNLDIGEMMHCTDIRYKRIYDRIFEVCFPVEIAGRSFREERASRNFEEMKRFIEAEGTAE